MIAKMVSARRSIVAPRFFFLSCSACPVFHSFHISFGVCVCFLLTRAQFLEFQWNRKFDRSILKARDLFLPPIFFLASFLNSHRLIIMDFFIILGIGTLVERKEEEKQLKYNKNLKKCRTFCWIIVDVLTPIWWAHLIDAFYLTAFRFGSIGFCGSALSKWHNFGGVTVQH